MRALAVVLLGLLEAVEARVRGVALAVEVASRVRGASGVPGEVVEALPADPPAGRGTRAPAAMAAECGVRGAAPRRATASPAVLEVARETPVATPAHRRVDEDEVAARRMDAPEGVVSAPDTLDRPPVHVRARAAGVVWVSGTTRAPSAPPPSYSHELWDLKVGYE